MDRWTWVRSLELGEQLRSRDVLHDLRRLIRWLQTQEGRIRSQTRRLNVLEEAAGKKGCIAKRKRRRRKPTKREKEDVEDWT